MVSSLSAMRRSSISRSDQAEDELGRERGQPLQQGEAGLDSEPRQRRHLRHGDPVPHVLGQRQAGQGHPSPSTAGEKAEIIFVHIFLGALYE